MKTKTTILALLFTLLLCTNVLAAETIHFYMGDTFGDQVRKFGRTEKMELFTVENFGRVKACYIRDRFTKIPQQRVWFLDGIYVRNIVINVAPDLMEKWQKDRDARGNYEREASIVDKKGRTHKFVYWKNTNNNAWTVHHYTPDGKINAHMFLQEWDDYLKQTGKKDQDAPIYKITYDFFPTVAEK